MTGTRDVLLESSNLKRSVALTCLRGSYESHDPSRSSLSLSPHRHIWHLAPHHLTIHTQSWPSSVSGTVAAWSKLEEAIQGACGLLESIFETWFRTFRTIQQAGDSNLKGRLKNLSEFNTYVTSGSDGEREPIKLLRSMVKQDFVPLMSSTLIILFSL